MALREHFVFFLFPFFRSIVNINSSKYLKTFIFNIDTLKHNSYFDYGQ